MSLFLVQLPRQETKGAEGGIIFNLIFIFVYMQGFYYINIFRMFFPDIVRLYAFTNIFYRSKPMKDTKNLKEMCFFY